MVNYKQSEVVGQQWRRCNSIQISNPYNGQATLVFGEEEIISLPGADIQRPMVPLSAVFDPTKEIPLVNPNTGELTGESISEMDVYIILFSKYMALAKERDDREALGSNMPYPTEQST
jgi:hypothetical protein